MLPTRTGDFSTEMDKVTSVARGFPPSYSKGGITSDTIMTDIRDSEEPPIFKALSVYKFWVIFVATTYPITISANGNFSVQSTFESYNCSSNMICLGQTQNNVNGNLSLLRNSYGAGIAYYKDPVRLVDSSTGQSASFSSRFVIDRNPSNYGESGMAFVISADNHTLGVPGQSLGIFNANGTTNFTSIVMEFLFDPRQDDGDYLNAQLTNATSITFDNPVSYQWSHTAYAWVEYSNETSQLELRVSNNNARPISSLLNSTNSLSDIVEEYMWIGFSAGAADSEASYSVGNWSFESNGIRASKWAFQPEGAILPGPNSPTSAPTLAPTSVPTAGTPANLNVTAISSGKPVSEKTGLTVGLSVGFSLVACIAIIVVLNRRFRRNARYKPRLFEQEDPMKKIPTTDEDVEMQIDGMLERFSYNQLSVATGGFTEKLGEGGFGSVFLGTLPSSGIEVAVKKIDSNSAQGEKEFMAEVSIINQSRHRNLIELRGWCKSASNRQYLLVYELMRQGSVDKWLFRPAQEETTHLSWPLRFNIVQGTAAALEYLHHSCTRQVIHRDVKSSNIMLDKYFSAKLGDFGLSRLVDHEDAAPIIRITDGNYCSTALVASDRTEKTTVLAGTPGYIAPEALVSPRCTDKTDVYAFGVVVLEIACGRRAYERELPREEMILVDWVWERMSGGEILSVVDRRLNYFDPKWMELMLKVALLCSHDEPEVRPSMVLVIKLLAGDATVPPIPPRNSNRQIVSIHSLLDPNDSNTFKSNVDR